MLLWAAETTHGHACPPRPCPALVRVHGQNQETTVRRGPRTSTRARRKLLCGGGGGGRWHGSPFAHPPLAAVPRGGVRGGGVLPAVSGRGGGGVHMAQNDPHVALIILTTHMWGEIFLAEKLFRAEICVPAPLAPTSVFTEAHFSPGIAPSPSAIGPCLDKAVICRAEGAGAGGVTTKSTTRTCPRTRTCHCADTRHTHAVQCCVWAGLELDDWQGATDPVTQPGLFAEGHRDGHCVSGTTGPGGRRRENSRGAGAREARGTPRSPVITLQGGLQRAARYRYPGAAGHTPTTTANNGEVPKCCGNNISRCLDKVDARPQ